MIVCRIESEASTSNCLFLAALVTTRRSIWATKLVVYPALLVTNLQEQQKQQQQSKQTTTIAIIVAHHPSWPRQHPEVIG